MTNWEASGADDLPLLDGDRDWDGDKAEDQIFRWAGGDRFDAEKARKGFFAYDADHPGNKTAYKLPFAYVVDGKLKAVPKALQAVAVVLEGGRGGVDLPQDVIRKVRQKVERYYKKMGDEVPW